MPSMKRLVQFPAAVVAVSFLLFTTAAGASDLSKVSPDHATGVRCAAAVASPVPQGTQQIHVCNNFSAAAGANIELFNMPRRELHVSAGTTTWPFVQSAPLTITDGTGEWVTLPTTLTNGGTYNYTVSCCPPTPAATKTVTVVG